jgi:hypothetical protein
MERRFFTTYTSRKGNGRCKVTPKSFKCDDGDRRCGGKSWFYFDEEPEDWLEWRKSFLQHEDRHGGKIEIDGGVYYIGAYVLLESAFAESGYPVPCADGADDYPPVFHCAAECKVLDGLDDAVFKRLAKYVKDQFSKRCKETGIGPLLRVELVQ